MEDVGTIGWLMIVGDPPIWVGPCIVLVVPVDGILVVVDVGDELTFGNPPVRTERVLI